MAQAHTMADDADRAMEAGAMDTGANGGTMNKNRDEELIEALSPVTPQRVRDIANRKPHFAQCCCADCEDCRDDLYAAALQLERNAEVLSQCKYFVDMAASTHPSATVRKSALIFSGRLLPAPPEAK